MPGSSRKCKSTMVTVEQMVDIALGTPEIGAVNFNVLHALLHVIVQQLNVQRCLVEFKGRDSERMEGIILSAKPGPILKLSAYKIDVNDGKPFGPPNPPTTLTKTPCECQEKDQTKKKDDDAEKTDKGKDEKETCAEKKDRKRKERENKCREEKEKEERTKEEKAKDEKPKEDKTKEEKVKEVKLKEDKEDADVSDKEGKKKKKSCPCVKDKDKEKEKGKDKEGSESEKSKGMSSSYYGSDSEAPCQTIIRVEAVDERCDTWRTRPALAHESMVKLEEKVTMLQDAFEALEQMPTNEELMKKAQGQVNSKTPVKDMWQLYNLQKRMESCEGAIEKLASMIEDLVKEISNFREAMLVIADAVDEMEGADEYASKSAVPCQGILQTKPPAAAPYEQTQTGPFAAIPSPMDPFSSEHVSISNAPPINANDSQGNAAGRSEASNGETGRDATTETSAATTTASVSTATAGTATPAAQTQYQSVGIGAEFYRMSAVDKFSILKDYVDCLMYQFKSLTDIIPINQLAAKLCAIVSLQKQLDVLEKEWREFLESVGERGISGLIQGMKSTKNDIENLSRASSKILADRQESELTIRNILQEIEFLKRVKADKEIMEDLLAEKADASVVNRKVSHDQFDAACDDLTKGLDEALDRLMAQEAIWNEAMEELQKDMDNKLDKTEIMPLKEFINKKLKSLQDKLKQLAQLRKDAEAAGAKSRILRNLNCISCDGDVIMRMDNVASPQRPAMPSTRSMKPYLTYELDQVRKAMKKGPQGRNLSQFGEIVAENQKKQTTSAMPLTNRETIDHRLDKLEHLCNRYCGGSHTITTPQQRVTRIGHFLTEFGPHATATFARDNLTFSEGKSGQMRPFSGNQKRCG